jgi:hypothetical protein
MKGKKGKRFHVVGKFSTDFKKTVIKYSNCEI